MPCSAAIAVSNVRVNNPRSSRWGVGTNTRTPSMPAVRTSTRRPSHPASADLREDPVVDHPGTFPSALPCRWCSGADGTVVLDLGDQPASDHFPALDDPGPDPVHP